MPTETTTTEMTIPVQDLKKIVAQLRETSPERATNEIWNDAAITCAFSFSSGGGSLDGWISYYDGTKVYFKLTTITSKTGTAAGTAAMPLIRVKPSETFSGKTGDLDVNGFMFGGALHLTCEGQAITQIDIPLLSAAPWDYHLAGKVSYTKAT